MGGTLTATVTGSGDHLQRGGVGDDGDRHRGGERPGRSGDAMRRATLSLASTSTDNTVAFNAPSSSFFRNEILATGFNLPTTMVFLPNGDMLVGEIGGTIRRLLPPYTQIEPTPFLQITNIGQEFANQGLYTIALDPNFATNHFIYVSYTLGSPNHETNQKCICTICMVSVATPRWVWPMLFIQVNQKPAKPTENPLDFETTPHQIIGRMMMTTSNHMYPNSQNLLLKKGQYPFFRREDRVK